MNIRWSPEAAADFAGIVEYIHKQNPSGLTRILSQSGTAGQD